MNIEALFLIKGIALGFAAGLLVGWLFAWLNFCSASSSQDSDRHQNKESKS
jgi:hypothetical protein